MTATPILEVSNLTQRFGGLVANSDISIQVWAGEILGLIGPNGAGKSTLFNLIAGAIKVTEGTIRFNGQDITGLTAPQRCAAGIARTFQVPRSFDSMSVLENVIVGALVRHGKPRAARVAAMEVLEFVGLEARANASAEDLTPSEKRRLEMARALATEPKLVLLDEVMTGLRPAEAQLGVELVRMIRNQGVTVIMVEHVMEIVMPLIDRAIVLELGKVLAEGTASTVAQDPRVIAAYLGNRHRAA
jgi:branched-chain amino acid transport system ATP-binding protein